MTTPAAPPLLIVAHGAPSCPPSQEMWLEHLADAVARLSGGPCIGATLAARAVFARKIGALAQGDGPVTIYPMFMADGWFTKKELPRRLAEAGLPADRQRILPPFGLDPGLPALCAALAGAAARDAGMDPAAARLVVAAHGSPRSSRPAEVARLAGEAARALGGFATAAFGFVDEAPPLVEALAVPGPAVCLPFFALDASHVRHDLPEAVAEAGFAGPVLAPVGLSPEAPAMIARAAAGAQTG